MNRLWILLLSAATTLAQADGVPPMASEDRQPAWIIELPESVEYVLVADTSSATMHRFRRDGSRVEWIDERYMSIGRSGAGKQRAWDRKTPLGAYFITERLDTSRMHEKYGVAAFPLDYPNAWDRHNERTGDGIWLHGVDRRNPDRPPLDTDGCLAIPNEELLKLADDLVPHTTPVLVARSMRWVSAEDVKRTRATLRLALESWLRNSNADVAIDDVLLLADPDDDNLFVSRFTEAHGAERRVRRLYWRRNDDSQWQIVAQDVT